MKKDRTIQDLDSYLGNFSSLIKKRVNNEKIKILDAGCGYGLVMAGLIKKFGDKIEIIGYNKSKEDGTLKDFKKKSIKFRIFNERTIKKIKLPKIVYLDADKKLPFNDNEFNFIYSLASIYLYKDKIGFLEECNRILKKEGIARIHLFELKKNRATLQDLRKVDMKRYLEISENEKNINSVDYFTKLKGVRIKFGKRKDNGHAIVYLEIKKQPKLDFNLKLISFVDDKLNGIESIYELK